MNCLTRALNRCYRGCGYLAGLCIVAMLIIILLQVIMRWLGLPFPSASNYAGYLMGASTFLAMAWTFHEGDHIRVGLLIEKFERSRPWIECWCLSVALATMVFIAWNVVDSTLWSWSFNDTSSGQDATPLWIPQIPLAFGACIFSLCLFDHLCRTLGNAVLGARLGGRR